MGLPALSRTAANADGSAQPGARIGEAKGSLVRNLLYLNGLAILAAVLNHAQSWGFTAMIFWTDRYRPVAVPNFDQVGSASYYLLNGVAGGISFAIPSFLFITGVFIAIASGRSRATISWRAVLTRVKFLIIPYCIWCGVAFAGLLGEGKAYDLRDYIMMALTGKVRGPYYYVPLLIQFYMLSFLIVPLARSHWKVLLLSSGAVQLLIQLLLYGKMYGFDTAAISFDQLPQWFFLTRAFWYVLGMIAGFRLALFGAQVRRYRWWVLAACLPLLFIAALERDWIFRLRVVVPMETLMGGLYAASVIGAALLFADRLPWTGWLEKVGSRSFGIYLVHVPVQVYTARTVYHLGPTLLAYPALVAAIVFASGLIVPLWLMALVERSPMRRLARYVFG